MLSPEYNDYLRDESRRMGRADAISFPRTESDICKALAAAREAHQPVTIQGARTGITGGAVPDGGHILNLSRMNGILSAAVDPASGECRLVVQPGLLLADLNRFLRAPLAADLPAAAGLDAAARRSIAESNPFFFPPDLTETSASLGGLVACNGSGARSYRFGAARAFVRSLRIMLADGRTIALQRGVQSASGRSFALVDGRIRIEGTLPSYAMPNGKSAAGYFAKDNMDLIDLFIGAEGTLGVLSQVEIAAIPLPPVLWGVMAFLNTEEDALTFVERARAAPARPIAIEYIDAAAIGLLRAQKHGNPAFANLQEPPSGRIAAVYVEYGGTAEAVDQAVSAMSDVLSDCGGDVDQTWLASSEREIDGLKKFRHAVPEAINLLIDERRRTEPKLTKLGTDLAVPDRALRSVVRLYREGLQHAGLESAVFGHIGNNHLHVNIIPRNLAEYEAGRALYLGWAREVVAMGGTISAEHGVGKLKVPLLREMYGDEGIRQMRELKRLFDPENVLNPGNLF
jgi:D-lactate dehydrogenase (cytochrome)